MLSREARVEGKGGKTEYIHAMLAASATVTDGRRREMGTWATGADQDQDSTSGRWSARTCGVSNKKRPRWFSQGGLSPSG